MAQKKLEVLKWIDATRKYWLTIKDIQKMKKGDKISVLVLDRNVVEVTESLNKERVVKSARTFFRDNMGTYIHSGSNLKGSLVLHTDAEGDISLRNFTFHLEYKKDHWYPVTSAGYLPTKDPQGIAKFTHKTKKHFTEFSTNTKIGWRGPMILAKHLKNLPDVYWDSNSN
jgi:hypothetical protein